MEHFNIKEIIKYCPKGALIAYTLTKSRSIFRDILAGILKQKIFG
jgi:hypothetical protein